MQDEPSQPKSVGNRRTLAFLTVICIVIAGSAVGYVLLTPQKETYGTVTNSDGMPLEGATISALGISTTTASDGGFHLVVRSWGKFVVQAEAERHWTQKLWAGQADGPEILNFNLTEDQEFMVQICGVFIHYLEESNLTSHIQVTCDWGTYLHVDDYASGGQMDLEPTGEKGQITAQEFNASSLVIMTRFLVSGIYWNEPGKCENCYVKVPPTVGLSVFNNVSDIRNLSDMFLPGGDLLGSINALDGIGASGYFISDPKKDLTLPDEMGVKVNVMILGERFQALLPVSYLRTDDSRYHIEVEIVSTSDRPVFTLCYIDMIRK